MIVYQKVNNHYLYLIIPDPMSGRKRRYTTHRISLAGMKTGKVIGRELPLAMSKELIQRFIDNEDRRPNFFNAPLHQRCRARR